MGERETWNEENWLLLLQLYLRQPAGVKALYSRPLVDLSLELHVEPQELYRRMFAFRERSSPSLAHLYDLYKDDPERLALKVDMVRRMRGFTHPKKFYRGVETHETFEKDFRPLAADATLKPVMLIMILDLYFRLTPNTMVAATPEVKELAKLMKVRAAKVADVMEVFQICDPYLKRADLMITPLLAPCQEVWNRYGNGDPGDLAALAAQLKAYFKA